VGVEAGVTETFVERPLIYAYEEEVALSRAWAAVEAALPAGWHFGELKHTSYRDKGERWLAMAWAEDDERTFEHGYGDSPVEALQALEAAVRAAHERSPR
jgi:hypothetical protein